MGHCNDVDQEYRRCPYCETHIEDEYHFIKVSFHKDYFGLHFTYMYNITKCYTLFYNMHMYVRVGGLFSSI